MEMMDTSKAVYRDRNRLGIWRNPLDSTYHHMTSSTAWTLSAFGDTVCRRSARADHIASAMYQHSRVPVLQGTKRIQLVNTYLQLV